MERWIALAVGVAAWTLVAGVAVLIVNAWADDQQVLAFFPIAAAVFVAALIGEVVTDRVFHRQPGGAP
ncbi:MAG: hypothetical protein WD939_02065 [Dehalococcoidia bacterium]